MGAPLRRAIVALTTVATLTLALASPAAGQTGFYATPDRLPKDEPGTILRSEPITAPAGAKAWRVLYTSKAVDGRDIAVSGIVVAPEGKAPKGGRPVVAWAHGTTGVADACAPSQDDAAATKVPYVDDLVAAGYVVVASDYEGLGTDGVHPYLVGPSEGRGVLDAVRAARRLDGSGAGRDLVVWGHSQGGHAALFAGEMARRYAPELRLQGVVAGAPAADAEALITGAARFPQAGVFYVLAAKGFAAAYPDELDEAALFSPEALPLTSVADTACVREVRNAFAGLASGPAAAGAAENPSFVARLRESSAANRPAGAPVLVVQGSADAIVRKGFTDAFVAKACEQGDVVDYRVYEGSGHVDVLIPAKADTLAWIAALVGGDAAANTCPT